ncbi:hypothetical protein KVO79_25270, partial [Serratia quinivorans]|nr:hypothetical protein [Serratia quinivorans]
NWYIFVMVSCTRKKTTMKTMRKLDTEDGSYDPIGTLSLITGFVSSLLCVFIIIRPAGAGLKAALFCR